MVEGLPLNVLGLNFGTRGWERLTIGGTYAETPGTGLPYQRVREQDQDGIDAEIMFTGASGGTSGAVFVTTRPTAQLCGRSTSTWVRSIARHSPIDCLDLVSFPRLVSMPPSQSSKCKQLGLVGVTLNSFPSGKSFPTKDDDRFWAAAVDLEMPITIDVDFRFPPVPTADAEDV